MSAHDLQDEGSLVAVDRSSSVSVPQYLCVCSFMSMLRGVCVYLCAVVVMASTTSMMRCRAESVPMVMSVPQKSLSIEPTMPTMFRWEELLTSVSVILPGVVDDK